MNSFFFGLCVTQIQRLRYKATAAFALQSESYFEFSNCTNKVIFCEIRNSKQCFNMTDGSFHTYDNGFQDTCVDIDNQLLQS